MLYQLSHCPSIMGDDCLCKPRALSPLRSGLRTLGFNCEDTILRICVKNQMDLEPLACGDAEMTWVSCWVLKVRVGEESPACEPGEDKDFNDWHQAADVDELLLALMWIFWSMLYRTPVPSVFAYLLYHGRCHLLFTGPRSESILFETEYFEKADLNKKCRQQKTCKISCLREGWSL